jgi:tRNA-dihydrouridine synthase
MAAETRCDAVMIGRAASYNPWIFRQIQDYIATGRYEVPAETERYKLMRHYYTLLNDAGEPDCVGKMKQFATYFTHGVRNGSKLRVEIYTKKTAPDILGAVDGFFSRELDGVAPDALSHPAADFPPETCELEGAAA